MGMSALYAFAVVRGFQTMQGVPPLPVLRKALSGRTVGVVWICVFASQGG